MVPVQIKYIHFTEKEASQVYGLHGRPLQTPQRELRTVK